MHLKRFINFLLVLFAGIVPLAGCKHESPATTVAPTAGRYPEAIAKIVSTRCAQCHNAAGAGESGGLQMDTWTALFNGSASGAVVIPYHLDNSVLLHYINTDSSLGRVAAPRMPQDDGTDATRPLSKEEFLTFRDWVLRGAPDADGNIPFGDNADARQKIYITMQACDLLGVVDAERRVVMRYVPVGVSPSLQEKPHAVRVSPDGRWAYVTLSSGVGVQKIDTRTDQIVGTVDLNAAAGVQGYWNIMHLSPDGSKFIISDYRPGGGLYVVNTATMTVEQQYVDASAFTNPHAITSNAAFDTFYVTSQNGNTVYRFSPKNRSYKQISLDGQPNNFIYGKVDPHEIIMSPDGSKYFVTCESSNDVRVVDAHTDAVLAVIPVGTKPQEFALAESYGQPYLFVTCQEDATGAGAGYRGSVYVINYQTNKVVQRIEGTAGRFNQPHGIAVDIRSGVVYVANRNTGSDGPAPHHAGACGGRNGYYTLINLATLAPFGSKRYEVGEEPYSADVRFKTPGVIQ